MHPVENVESKRTKEIINMWNPDSQESTTEA